MLEGYVCELAELAQWGDGRLTQVLKEVDQLPNSQVRDESATVLVAIRRTQREIRAKNAANEAIARMLRGEIKPRW